MCAIDNAVSYQLDEEADIDSVDVCVHVVDYWQQVCSSCCLVVQEDVVSLSTSRVEELSNQVSEMASELQKKDDMLSVLMTELQALKVISNSYCYGSDYCL